MSDPIAPRQLVFDVTALRPPPRSRRLIVGDSNQEAAELVRSWPHWPAPVMALAGPPGSGKSVLGEVWADRAGAERLHPSTLAWEGESPRPALLDMAGPEPWSAAAERGLFHRLNNALAGEADLLLVAREAPARWPVRLPDLRTRLAAIPLAVLEPPDDALLASVLAELFRQRDLVAGKGVIPYLVARIERSLAAAADAVAAIDHISLSRRLGVTVPVAAEALGIDGVLDAEPGPADDLTEE